MKTYTTEVAVDTIEVYEVKAKSKEEALKKYHEDASGLKRLDDGEENIGEPIIVAIS